MLSSNSVAASARAPSTCLGLRPTLQVARPQHRRLHVTYATSSEEGPLSGPLGVLAATIVAVAACTSAPAPAMAAPKEVPEAVYFGNGCFWGRQFDFVQSEKRLGRAPEQISAVVGYAGGRQVGPDGKVCYYLGDPRSVYERLGHAEVVQVALNTEDEAKKQEEFRLFANTYFKQFRRTDSGQMQRLDPQDAGPGYRNVIGLPGGVNSPLFKVLQAENVNNMDLRAGNGNEYVDAAGNRRIPTEDDLLNVVWIVDSSELPFYRAERYHQFHNGIGKMFPLSYTWDQKNLLASQNKIDSTGCPELPF